MCAAGCKGTAIALELGIAAETLYLRCEQDQGMLFTAFRQAHMERGGENIRHKQYQVAMKGDKGMLIWLGKQLLGQRDRYDLSGAAATAPPPVINVVVQAPQISNGDAG